MGVILTDCDDWMERVLGVKVLRDKDLAQTEAKTQAGKGSAAKIEALLARHAAVIGKMEQEGIDTRAIHQERKEFDGWVQSAKNKPKVEEALSKLLPLFRKQVAQAEQDITRQSASEVGGASRGLMKLRDTAAAEIGKLGKSDPLKADYQKDLKELDGAIAKAQNAASRKEEAKLLAEADELARTLCDDVGRATGDKAGVEKAYKDAIEQRFGVKISNPGKLKKLHLDGLYKMLGKVPLSDVVQGKFAKIAYEKPKSNEEVAAYYSDTKISFPEMEGSSENYTDPKTKEKVPCNSFNITTLHELGHSVDDRFNVMQKAMGRKGAGGWRQESIDTVVKAFAAALAKEAPGVPATELTQLVTTALTDGAPAEKPAAIPQVAWQKLQPKLAECEKVRQSASPWENGTPIIVPGRGYHQSGDDDWFSYDAATRAGGTMTVNGYQWRSPFEFFAELYAFTWFNEREPPTGVDPVLAVYLYSGKKAKVSAPAVVKGH